MARTHGGAHTQDVTVFQAALGGGLAGGGSISVKLEFPCILPVDPTTGVKFPLWGDGAGPTGQYAPVCYDATPYCNTVAKTCYFVSLQLWCFLDWSLQVGAVLMVVKKGGLGGKSSKRERLKCDSSTVEQETSENVVAVEVVGGSSELNQVQGQVMLLYERF